MSGKNTLKFTHLLLKKIFILIPWFHPAYKAGGPIQSIANMVGQLGDNKFQFSIFCSNNDMDGSLITGVAFDEWVNYNAGTKVWYSSTNNILPLLQDAVKKENPGYLFIIGVYDWQYNFKPLLFCKGVKKIISVRGMLHPGALSQKGFKKKIFLRLWKMLGLHKGKLAIGKGQGANVFHATDEAEKKYIEQVFGETVNVKVAANFPRVLPVQPVIRKEVGCLKLVSVALISPMKNILWVLEALGTVDRGSLTVDRIIYDIYGPVKDKQYWDACLNCIKKMPANVTVNYHGDIQPDKVINVLADNHVFILPSKSENFGHSLYEALSAGRPVITSNNTPWVNLEAVKAGMNVSLNDTNELINAIRLFAEMQQDELEVWSAGARKYADGAINVKQIEGQYEQMFG